MERCNKCPQCWEDDCGTYRKQTKEISLEKPTTTFDKFLQSRITKLRMGVKERNQHEN